MELSNEELDRIARKDLEKTEYDVLNEAQAAVEEFDAEGDEAGAAAAAAVAFNADQAMREAE
ncbi:hypothetical protein [Anaerotardibacter muris]|uniref:hypothetical protein n=1 Tax=Anaerotardibacter muris TaxID=2941505 RepID=UPI00203D477F|nr:hypothetical protein [Anaerotardibacter muris]